MKSAALQTLLAAGAFAIGYAQAQPVVFYPAGGPAGSTVQITVDIDQDWQTPSPCLANLFRVEADHLGVGFTAYGETYGPIAGSGPYWRKTFDDCGLPPDSVEGDFESGFTVSYSWGDCSAVDSNGGADVYLGTYTGANDPRWDCAELVVSVTPTFTFIAGTLSAHEVRSLTPSVIWDFIYTF